MTAASWPLVALLVIPLLGALALLLLPRAAADRHAVHLRTAVTAALVPLSVIAARAPDVDVPWVTSLGLRLHIGIDGISGPLVVLTAALTFLCLAYCLPGVPAGRGPSAFVGLLLVLETGMLATFTALDLLLFFVAFEVVLLPMWALIAGWGGERRGPAATTFVLYTLLGSALMLLGILLVGLQAGTFDMTELAARGGAGLAPRVQLLAALAMLVGFGIKAPVWPLHTWLPEAHTAAPTVGSVLLAGVLLKMGTYGIVRVAVPVVPEGMTRLAPYLAAFAVVSIVYGSLACLAQRDLKRLIAYSSVGHMGFVLLGIASLTPVGITGALYANIAHGVITGLLFFLAGAVKDRHGTADLDALGRGLYARAPRLGGLLAFGCVASLGLPGLAGFWGEMLAMLGAFDAHPRLDRTVFLVLVGIAGLGTVLTAAYLLTLVRRVAQGTSDERWTRADDGGHVVTDASRTELLVWSPLVTAAVALGLWPGILLEVTTPAVTRLVEGAL